MRSRSAILALVLVFLLLCACAGGSSGDRHVLYQRCFTNCKATGCAQYDVRQPLYCDTICHGKGPWMLRPMLWNCESDCAYRCMRLIEWTRTSVGLAPLKYHGKWAFQRILGMQELASVLTSYLNLLQHLRGLYGIHSAVAHTQGQYPYYVAWLLFSLVNCVAWTASTIFHARDTYATERFDYASAFTVVIASCAAAIMRMVPSRNDAVRHASLVCLSVLWFWHVRGLLGPAIEYGFNMKLCLALGLAQSVAWVAWAQLTQHPARWYVHCFMLAMNAAVTLEILDFAPIWGLVDAHALWHAATVPLTGVWYTFIEADVAYVAGTGNHGKGRTAR